MEQLTIVGSEDNLLVLATESGERFTLAIDDVMRAEVRRARATAPAPMPSVSPRDIQSHIRSGLSSAEVAELFGITIEHVQRFEGPVLAEREHVVGQALAVPVLIGSEVEPDAQPTFGVAIRGKLAELAAEGERWASWKEERGWVIKLEFRANDVEHDARWAFDPRRSTLTPLNADATQLSRQGSLPEGLIPRLRAVDSERRQSPYKDDSRFDSGAFGTRPLVAVDADAPAVPAPPEKPTAAVQEAAINRAPDDVMTSAETADLLEALRRRRGQREASPSAPDVIADAATAAERESSPISLFEDFAAGDLPSTDATPEPPTQAPETSSKRRRRNAMPSWDEIVFGARVDE